MCALRSFKSTPFLQGFARKGSVKFSTTYETDQSLELHLHPELTLFRLSSTRALNTRKFAPEPIDYLELTTAGLP